MNVDPAIEFWNERCFMVKYRVVLFKTKYSDVEKNQLFDTYEEAREYGYFLLSTRIILKDKVDPETFMESEEKKDPFVIIAEEVGT